MKELPLEVWSLVARHLKKPPPPPPGEPANWNDHFNEHDLLSLQRVCQTTYRAVCSLLYSSPIVQNVGQFLDGVEESQHEKDRPMKPLSEHSVPYHKSLLLDQVKKLIIIHASSRTPLKDPYIQAARPECRWDGELTEQWDVDILAAADLDGWGHTRYLLSRAPVDSEGKVSISFARLQSLSFNTWDDGRWNIYIEKERRAHAERYRRRYIYKCTRGEMYDGDAWVDVCPSQFVTKLFEQIFLPVLASQEVSVCHGSGRVPGGMTCDKAVGRHVYHGSIPTSSTARGPTRVYLSAVSAAGIDTEYLGESFVLFMKNAFEQAVRQTKVSEDTDAISEAIPIIEICISTQMEGQEGELQEAQAKEAVERFFKADAEVPKACLGRFKVLIGDEVPPCPACGAKA